MSGDFSYLVETYKATSQKLAKEISQPSSGCPQLIRQLDSTLSEVFERIFALDLDADLHLSRIEFALHILREQCSVNDKFADRLMKIIEDDAGMLQHAARQKRLRMGR